MSLIFITKDFAVDPNDVSSLEKFGGSGETPSGGYWASDSGTIVIQKNGRKTYLKGMEVNEVHALLFSKIREVKEETKMLTQVSE